MLARYSHIRMEAKRRKALESIVSSQRRRATGHAAHGRAEDR
jgi:hypothetical protein